jgi:hypothetical protein
MFIPSETEFFAKFLSSGKNDWLRLLREESGKESSSESMFQNFYDEIKYSNYQDVEGFKENKFSERKIGEWKVRLDFDFNDFELGISALKKMHQGVDVVGIFADAGRIQKWNQTHLKGISASLSDKTSILFACGSSGFIHCDQLLSVSNMRNDAGIYGSYDLIGEMMQTGLEMNRESIFDGYAEVIAKMRKHKTTSFPIKIGSDLFRKAGSSVPQELAYALSLGVEILSALKDRGVEPVVAQNYIYFQFATGSEFYLEIAKYRVFRLLWNRILREFGCMEDNSQIHAVSSDFEITYYEKYSNQIRVTLQALSSVIGGADVISNRYHLFVKPEDVEKFTLVSRDILLLLKHENFLFGMTDPIAGAPSFSEIFKNVSERSWNIFQDLENTGGILRAYEKGAIVREIENILNLRKIDVFTQKRKITGINCYVDHHENLFESAAKITNNKIQLNKSNNFIFNNVADSINENIPLSQNLFDIYKLQSEQYLNPVKPTRLVEEMEILRMNADRYTVLSGMRPVFIIITDQDEKNLYLKKMTEVVRAIGCSPIIWNLQELQNQWGVIKNESTAGSLVFTDTKDSKSICYEYLRKYSFPQFLYKEMSYDIVENLNPFSFENYKIIKLFYRKMFDRLSSM